MAGTKLTKRVVDGVEVRQSRYILFDSVVAGFGLRVMPTGAKSWIFEYRPGEGGRNVPKKRVTIGAVGDFTPDQARKEAERLRALVKTGGDPQGEKTRRREAATTRELAEAFLEHIEEKRSASTHEGYKRTLELHFLPSFGARKAASVEHAEIAKLHRGMKANKPSANKLLRVISSMYNWGASKAQRLLPSGTNPASDIEPYVELPRKRMLNPEELERLGSSMRVAETEGLPWALNPEKKVKHRRKDAEEQTSVIDPYAVAAIRLLIFTGCRLREILRLKWTDVDFVNGILTIRKHKTDRMVGAKTVVLNAPALAVLSSLERIGAYVVAGESAGKKDEKPRADLKRPWEAIRRNAGLGDVRIHDLRHNFGAFAASGNLQLPMIGSLLGHASTQSTERYSHFQWDPRRAASNAVAGAIAAAIGEAPIKDNVVPMDKARKG
ncbi:MAG: hypothetical protein ABS76_14430 [Pelagibacterium sp. SCN 64-44]|nr:MAG: hypothetical protein ABS76_14430 [Pelagibacterium sp. SCN 64-44]